MAFFNDLQCVFRRKLCLAFLGLCFLLPSCSSTRVPKGSHSQYNCDHARQVMISYDLEGGRAAVLVEGKAKNLKKVSQGSGKTFTDGIVSLVLDEETATLLDDGFPIYTNCRSELELS